MQLRWNVNVYLDMQNDFTSLIVSYKVCEQSLRCTHFTEKFPFLHSVLAENYLYQWQEIPLPESRNDFSETQNLWGWTGTSDLHFIYVACHFSELVSECLIYYRKLYFDSLRHFFIFYRT